LKPLDKNPTQRLNVAGEKASLGLKATNRGPEASNHIDYGDDKATPSS